MLSLLSWIVTGLIVGLIARALVPGRQDIGMVMTIILGVGSTQTRTTATRERAVAISGGCPREREWTQYPRHARTPPS